MLGARLPTAVTAAALRVPFWTKSLREICFSFDMFCSFLSGSLIMKKIWIQNPVWSHCDRNEKPRNHTPVSRILVAFRMTTATRSSNPQGASHRPSYRKTSGGHKPPIEYLRPRRTVTRFSAGSNR